jgi:hypothetical protein
MIELKCEARERERENIFSNFVDVDWRIGSTHDSGARGPGFDSHPDPGWHFNGKNSHLPSFRQHT